MVMHYVMQLLSQKLFHRPANHLLCSWISENRFALIIEREDSLKCVGCYEPSKACAVCEGAEEIRRQSRLYAVLDYLGAEPSAEAIAVSFP